jgi:predicted PurR-regulated permease PerM
MPKSPVNSTVARYFLALFCLSILLMGRLLWPFVSTLIISVLLVTLFRPVYHGLRTQIPGHLASLTTCLLIVLLVFIPLIFFVIALSEEAVVYAQYLREINITDRVKDLMQNNTLLASAQMRLATLGFTLRPEDLSSHLSSSASSAALFIYTKATAWAGNIVRFIVDFTLMILVIFFLLMDYDRLQNFVFRLSPLPEEQNQQLIRKFQEIAQASLLGNGICGLIQGILGGLLFVYFDFNSPILWGLLMGAAAFVPIIGIGLVLLPTALIVFINGHTGHAIFITGFYLLLSMSVDYLLKPQLVGRKVNMHALLVFLGILGGIKLFGVLGIVYGPLIITVFLTMAEIYLNNYAPPGPEV